MASTGKSEIMASVFAIALNVFMQEYKDNKKEETHQEPANQPGKGGDSDGPQRCKRGNLSGKKKLFDLQRVLFKNEKELEAIARHFGPDTYLKRPKGIYAKPWPRKKRTFLRR
jgi:hypothetical protein